MGRNGTASSVFKDWLHRLCASTKILDALFAEFGFCVDFSSIFPFGDMRVVGW